MCLRRFTMKSGFQLVTQRQLELRRQTKLANCKHLPQCMSWLSDDLCPCSPCGAHYFFSDSLSSETKPFCDFGHIPFQSSENPAGRLPAKEPGNDVRSQETDDKCLLTRLSQLSSMYLPTKHQHM